jgi:hypothetical protein
LFFSFFFFFFLFLFLFVGASRVLLQPLGGRANDAMRFSLSLRGISFIVFPPRNLHGQLFGQSG